MLIAHKIALKPNNVQATYFARAAGTARFAYNWALDKWQKQYEAWKLDNTQPRPSEMAIIQLGQAFQNFFAGRAKYPKFRKKGVHDRFSLSNDQFSVDASRIRIPHLGWVRIREVLRFAGKIMSATVSQHSQRSQRESRQSPAPRRTKLCCAACSAYSGASAARSKARKTAIWRGRSRIWDSLNSGVSWNTKRRSVAQVWWQTGGFPAARPVRTAGTSWKFCRYQCVNGLVQPATQPMTGM